MHPATALLLVHAAAAAAAALSTARPVPHRMGAAAACLEGLLLVAAVESHGVVSHLALGAGIAAALAARWWLLAGPGFLGRLRRRPEGAVLLAADAAAAVLPAFRLPALAVRTGALAFLVVRGPAGCAPDRGASPRQPAGPRRGALAGGEPGAETELPGAALERVGRTVGTEVTNLVSTIRGYAELLRSHHGPEGEAEHFTEQILDAARRIGLLAEKFAGLSERGPIAIHPVDVASAVRKAVARLERLEERPPPARPAIEVSLPSEPLLAGCAEVPLVRALYYVLENAARATPAGGRVHVAAGRGGCGQAPEGATEVVVCVEDEGEGMEEPVLLRAFRPFFTTRAAEGRHPGLGLTAARNLVQAMGGSLDLENRRRGGARATMRLLPAAGLEAAGVVRAGGLVWEGVLLVEEDSGIRALCSQILLRTGLRVFPCTDGEAALALLERTPERFSLAVVDEGVRGGMGREVARSLLERSDQLRVVLLACGPDRSTRVQPCPWKARLVLVERPFGAKDLVGAVEQFLPPGPRAG